MITPERLTRAVDTLGQAIARGDVTPNVDELEALAEICDRHECPLEAVRVHPRARGESSR